MIDASPPKSADKPLDEKPPADLKFLRWALIACQALTFAVTWPLWESRIDNPWMPHLPAIPEVIAAPLQFNWGIPLLATLVWSLVHAPSGLVLHAIFLALAIVVDQLRLQPEFVSLLILMVGTLPHRGLQVVARFHLAALWFYAGFHKLLSEGYWNSGGAEHLMRTFNMLDANSAQVLAIASAVTECMVGICWMIPPTRLAASVCALLLHFGILFSLLIQGWNVAVWPWNVGLMVAAIGFAIDWEEPGHVSAARAGWQGLLGASLMLVTPLLFYVGYFDSYLCHCLYSGNTAQARFYSGPDDASGESLVTRSMEAIHVPFPPEHRLYEQYFRKVARPGDMLSIRDKRWYYHWRGWGERWLEKPLDAGPDAEIIEHRGDELVEPSESSEGNSR